mmetsp:Transcript_43116/g.126779  ORF Transcript_43116/g.126779 Transcript_43116/m.126779 type:complete len:150 (+) Transcript_43116:81-530(+)
MSGDGRKRSATHGAAGGSSLGGAAAVAAQDAASGAQHKPLSLCAASQTGLRDAKDAACGARHEQLGLQVSALRLRGGVRGWSAPAGEERAHTQQRSRVATTGRNTLKREFDIVDAPAKLQLGGALQPAFVKKMAVAARAGDRGSALWRA